MTSETSEIFDDSVSHGIATIQAGERDVVSARSGLLAGRFAKFGGSRRSLAVTSKDDGPKRRHPRHSPTPEFATMVKKEQARLLALLDDELRKVALLKLQGYTVREIAAERDCSVRTVERELRLIRKKWEEWERGKNHDEADAADG